MSNSYDVNKVVDTYLKNLSIYFFNYNGFDSGHIYKGGQYIGSIMLYPPPTRLKTVISVSPKTVRLFLDLFGVKNNEYDFRVGVRNSVYIQSALKGFFMDKINNHYIKPRGLPLMTDDNSLIIERLSSQGCSYIDKHDFIINFN